MNLAKYSPAELILASRTKSKLEAVVKTIRESGASVQPKIVLLDLASQQSVRNAATVVSGLVNHIDILVNNAAIVTSDLRHTDEGIELQFGTGHIGHFLFTTLLLPLFKKVAASSSVQKGATRIINISSMGHRLSPVRFHDYNFEGREISTEEQPPKDTPKKFLPTSDEPYKTFAAYGQAKTANILFSIGLNDKFAAEGIKSYAVHPGGELSLSFSKNLMIMLTNAAIWTDLSRNLNTEDYKFIEGIAEFVTHDQGTSTMLVAALDPALNEHEGSAYMSDCQITDAAPHAQDVEVARRLWKLSEDLTSDHRSRI